jgi:hypothetical protein
VTTYGRSFKLNQTYSTSVGAAAYAGGTAGTVNKKIFLNENNINIVIKNV